MKKIDVSSTRWLVLLCAFLLGIISCFIRWRPKPNYVAWGWPIPWMVWEKTIISGKETWFDFPGIVGMFIDPLIAVSIGLIIFWIMSRFIKEDELPSR